MNIIKRRAGLAIGIAAISLLAAACGSDDDEGGSATTAGGASTSGGGMTPGQTSQARTSTLDEKPSIAEDSANAINALPMDSDRRIMRIWTEFDVSETVSLVK